MSKYLWKRKNCPNSTPCNLVRWLRCCLSFIQNKTLSRRFQITVVYSISSKNESFVKHTDIHTYICQCSLYVFARPKKNIIKVPSLCEINHTKPKRIWFSLLFYLFARIFFSATKMCTSVAKEVQTLSIWSLLRPSISRFAEYDRKKSEYRFIFSSKFTFIWFICLIEKERYSRTHISQ